MHRERGHHFVCTQCDSSFADNAHLQNHFVITMFFVSYRLHIQKRNDMNVPNAIRVIHAVVL